LEKSAINTSAKEARMNGKQIALGIVLADFVALTGYAVWVHGYVGIFQVLFANAAGILASTDLTIALSMIAVWMWRDAESRGISAMPYLVVTLFLGSVGTLAYLIRVLGSEASQPIAMPARRVA
jgi:uncharacterized protein DUF2834